MGQIGSKYLVGLAFAEMQSLKQVGVEGQVRCVSRMIGARSRGGKSGGGVGPQALRGVRIVV